MMDSECSYCEDDGTECPECHGRSNSEIARGLPALDGLAWRLYVGHREGTTGATFSDVHVRDTISQVLSAHGIQGATFSSADGLWRNVPERSSVVTISGHARSVVEAAAEDIRVALSQEAIGIQRCEPIRFLAGAS